MKAAADDGLVDAIIGVGESLVLLKIQKSPVFFTKISRRYYFCYFLYIALHKIVRLNEIKLV